MEIYCKDCLYYGDGKTSPLLPVWTQYEHCCYYKNVIKHNIGKYPGKIAHGNLVDVAGHYDGLYSYRKTPPTINKNHNCKWFAVDHLMWFRFIKKRKLEKHYGRKYSIDNYTYYRELNKEEDEEYRRQKK